jgi:hypothetical protein
MPVRPEDILTITALTGYSALWVKLSRIPIDEKVNEEQEKTLNNMVPFSPTGWRRRRRERRALRTSKEITIYETQSVTHEQPAALKA